MKIICRRRTACPLQARNLRDCNRVIFHRSPYKRGNSESTYYAVPDLATDAMVNNVTLKVGEAGSKVFNFTNDSLAFII